jgi:hypothetical protein
VLDSRFVYLAMFLSAVGAFGYVRDTWRGLTSPNRVTWSLWALEGVLAFVVEVQQHVGTASLITLMLGLVPAVVVVVSFRNAHSVWKLRGFDIVCGVVSLAGLIFWLAVNQPTIALVSFVAADQIAALPTVRKSWLAPETETAVAFVMGSLNTGITVLTLKQVTTAGALFPGTITAMDAIIAFLIISRIGPRLRRVVHAPSTH